MKKIIFFCSTLLPVLSQQTCVAQALSGSHKQFSKKVESLCPQKRLSFEHKQELKKAFCLKLATSPYGVVAQKYLKELEAEHEILLQELYALVNITPALFQQRFVDYYNYFDQQESIAYSALDLTSVRALEQTERECIDDIVSKIGIDSSCITVVCHASTHDCYAFVAAFNTIFIDVSKIPAKSQLYKALIGHELTHVIFDDWVIANVVNYYCGKKHTDFINKYSRFCEKRADIVGCLIESQSAYAFYCYYAQDSFDQEISTHPTNRQRAAYLYTLSCAIKQELLKIAATKNLP